MATMAASLAFERITSRMSGVQPKRNGGVMCYCPAHADGSTTGRRSLSIDDARDGVLLHCFAGCEPAQIMEAAGLTMADLFNDRRDPVPPPRSRPAARQAPPQPTTTPRPQRPQPSTRRRVVAQYDYHDDAGQLAFQVVRYEPKGFAQRRPDGKGGWIWNTDGCPPLLYHEAELRAEPERAVLLCEGEKDVDNACALGFLATTVPRGAAAWSPVYAGKLAGRHVTILPDNDAPGRSFADAAAADLAGIAASVRIVRLPGLDAKGDVSDWIAAGGTAEELRWLIRNAPPVADPATSARDDPSPEHEPERARVTVAPPRPELSWPEPSPHLFYGLAGEVAYAADPFTESDMVATVVNYLVMFGNAVGRSPYFPVGAARHRANENMVIVGQTSRSRKGTSHAYPYLIVSSADPGWGKDAQGSGLSSGEGLIWRLRDPIKTVKNGSETVDDDGARDKRLLLVEEEFSAVLKVARREGSITSELIRKAWDGGRLENMTKRSPVTATGAHVSVLGHITMHELEALATDVDIFNGTLNRFGLFLVRRSKLLPDADAIPASITSPLIEQTTERLHEARRIGQMRRTPEANALWRAVYAELSDDRDGLHGALTARAEAHVLRYSMLYALTDGSAEITVDHVQAALALWQFADDSARYLFGDKLGDPVADRIISSLRMVGSIDQSDISGLFSRHVPAALINAALDRLMRAGRIRGDRERTGGRPRIVWSLIDDRAQEEGAHDPTA